MSGLVTFVSHHDVSGLSSFASLPLNPDPYCTPSLMDVCVVSRGELTPDQRTQLSLSIIKYQQTLGYQTGKKLAQGGKVLKDCVVVVYDRFTNVMKLGGEVFFSEKMCGLIQRIQRVSFNYQRSYSQCLSHPLASAKACLNSLSQNTSSLFRGFAEKFTETAPHMVDFVGWIINASSTVGPFRQESSVSNCLAAQSPDQSNVLRDEVRYYVLDPRGLRLSDHPELEAFEQQRQGAHGIADPFGDALFEDHAVAQHSHNA